MVIGSVNSTKTTSFNYHLNVGIDFIAATDANCNVSKIEGPGYNWKKMTETGDYSSLFEHLANNKSEALKIMKTRFLACKNSNDITRFYPDEERSLFNAIQLLDPNWTYSPIKKLPWNKMAKTGNYDPLFKRVNYDKAEALKIMKQRVSACKIDNAKAKFYGGEEEALIKAIQKIEPNWTYIQKTTLPWEEMAKTGDYTPIFERTDNDKNQALSMMKNRFSNCLNNTNSSKFCDGEELALTIAIRKIVPDWVYSKKAILPWEEMAKTGNYKPVLELAENDPSGALKILRNRFSACKSTINVPNFYPKEERALTKAIQALDPDWTYSPKTKQYSWKKMAETGDYSQVLGQVGKDNALNLMKDRFSNCKGDNNAYKFYLKEEGVLSNAIRVLDSNWIYAPKILP